MYVCIMYVHMYVRMYVRMYVCTYVCMYYVNMILIWLCMQYVHHKIILEMKMQVVYKKQLTSGNRALHRCRIS